MRTSFALLTLTALSCAALHPAPTQLSERVGALVELNYLDAAGIEQKYTSGSAAPITPDTYLTAAHVVEAPGWMRDPVIRVNGSAVDYFTVLGDLDAAFLVMLQPHEEEVWTVDARALEPAEVVYVSGWGLGEHLWSRGYASLDQDRISMTVSPGDSGGPVMDADMDILGIVVTKYRGVAHHTGIVPIQAIIAELPTKVVTQMRFAR